MINMCQYTCNVTIKTASVNKCLNNSTSGKLPILFLGELNTIAIGYKISILDENCQLIGKRNMQTFQEIIMLTFKCVLKYPLTVKN